MEDIYKNALGLLLTSLPENIELAASFVESGLIDVEKLLSVSGFKALGFTPNNFKEAFQDKRLIVDGEDVAKLPKTLPATIEKLYCDGNPKLKILPTDLPKGIRRLVCNESQLPANWGDIYSMFPNIFIDIV